MNEASTHMNEASIYPHVEAKPDFPAIESRILAYWEEHGVFEASVEAREAGESGQNDYVFYDGPPFANGLPHTGNLLTGYVKDVIPRYQTMRGRRVERRFGWDCHGLPPEMEAEKELGVAGRKAIIEFGIDRFNEQCRSSVMRYTNEWQRYVNRQARWVDFENDYKTMDAAFMESVMWAFKQLWEKGLIYEAYRVLPYSWGAETPLSNFEIRMDDATRPREDPAITVAFDLRHRSGDPGRMRLWAWTTTPWTLPSNLALAVDAEMRYSVFKDDSGGESVFHVLAEAAEVRYESELRGLERWDTLLGSDLIGRDFEPLFDYFVGSPEAERAFKVLGADFVETEEGTGVVHMAPGFGEEDQQLCEAAGIGVVTPVDESGRFTTEVTDWAGVGVFEANRGIISSLKRQGRVLRHDTYVHNYPHCWRTDTPVIYKALSSWYVKVTSIRERMLELNGEINWIPDHVKEGRFGKWLEGARDWSISRNRFWGSPIPVWRSDNPAYPRIDVYGSLDELERDFGVRPDDLHRPFIDSLTRPNPDDPSGESVMRRVPEVLDCWFESGSMPFAQNHYPFENKEWFEKHFPADFIVEYVNQTRGWFYTLHVLATALFDRPPFLNALCHGVVLAADGSKLSKRLRNYTDPEVIFAKQGSDAYRWYLMSSPVLRGGDLRIQDAGVEAAVREILYPIWNAYYFFCLYANADERRAEPDASSQHVLDRYILAKSRQLVEEAAACLDSYDVPGACSKIEGFLPALNNWYIRRSRERFWSPAAESDPAEKQAAYNTLYVALLTLLKVAAPLLPLLSEAIYLGLTDGGTGGTGGGTGGNGRNGRSDASASLHLCDWPEVDSLPSDPKLVKTMDLARAVCSGALGVRVANRIPARWPLASLTAAGKGAESLRPFVDLIAAEVNVKEVHLTEELGADVSFRLRPRGDVLGPLLGASMQPVMAAARRGEWEHHPDGGVVVEGIRLSEEQYKIELQVEDNKASAVISEGGLVVSLDIELTPELRSEGLARHLVRLLQQGRRDLDFNVSDRVELTLDLGDGLAEVISAHEHYIAEQVLALKVDYADLAAETAGGQHSGEGELDGQKIRWRLDRVTP